MSRPPVGPFRARLAPARGAISIRPVVAHALLSFSDCVFVAAVAELQSLSAACNKLWALDTNRLEPNVHYELNVQEGKNAFARGDVAREALFAFVHPSVFERPTFKLLFELLDNYEREVHDERSIGVHVTALKRWLLSLLLVVVLVLVPAH